MIVPRLKSSPNFPTTPGVVGPKLKGPRDSTVGKLKPDGSGLLYATYLDGRGAEMIRSMAFGPKGEVYLVGNTASPDFPTTPGALQPKLGGNHAAFIIKLVAADDTTRKSVLSP